jgi:hypothetical protein
MNPNLQSIPGVDDRRCAAPAEVQEEDQLRLLLQHSTLSPYFLDTNFWRAPPLASNHLSPSTRCLAQFIAPVGRWLQEGYLQVRGSYSARQGGAAVSLGVTSPMIQRLWTWTTLFTTPEAVVGRLLGSVSPGTLVDRCSRAYLITV